MSRALTDRPRSLFAPTLADFTAAVAAQGGKAAHARELRRGVLRHGGRPLAAIEVRRVALPHGLIERLDAQAWRATESSVALAAPSGDGSTKLVLALADGKSVEAVVMPAEKGHFAVCISSQVGCPVGCPFCASGIGGLVRHLAAHEIVEQVVHARAIADVRRIVVMGIGEPLLNFDALLPALDVLVAEGGFAEPRIVVSSVGFPERVRRLAASGRRFGLAISLHSIDDAQRDQLVPAMRGVKVAEVIAAAAAWADATGGRIQFEYVVLRGVNDEIAACDELVRQLKGLPAYVNFIAWNDVPGLPFTRPEDERVAVMVRRCRDGGLLATRRRTLGGDATAACGQLRRSLGAR